jgi:hypothetical protein
MEERECLVAASPRCASRSRVNGVALKQSMFIRGHHQRQAGTGKESKLGQTTERL